MDTLDNSYMTNLFDTAHTGDNMYVNTNYLDDNLDNLLLPNDNMLSNSTEYYSDASTNYDSSNSHSHSNTPVQLDMNTDTIVNRPTSVSWDWSMNLSTPKHSTNYSTELDSNLFGSGGSTVHNNITATQPESITVKQETNNNADSTTAQNAPTMGPALASLLASNPLLLKNKQLATMAFTGNVRKGGTHESRAKAKLAAKQVADMVGIPVNMLSQIGNELVEYNKQLQNSKTGGLHVNTMTKSDSGNKLFDLESVDDSSNSSTCISPAPGNNEDNSVESLLQEVESKKRRLARKAELARMSRKRKKTRMGDLEAEVERLQAEIQQLKKHKTGSSNDGVGENDEKEAIQNCVNSVIDTYYNVNNSSENVDTDATLKHSIDDFVCEHTKQQTTGDNVLQNLQHYIKPILALDTFYYLCTNHSEQTQNSLYHALFTNELHVNSVQLKDLNSMKTTVYKQVKHTAELYKTYQKFQSLLTKHLKIRVTDMEKLRCILTPTQFVKYLEWTEQYGGLCQELNKQQNAVEQGSITPQKVEPVM